MKKITGWLLMGLGIIGVGVGLIHLKKSPESVLISLPAKRIPIMDGKLDDAWKLVRPLVIETKVPSHKTFAKIYQGKKYTVTLRSMHTEKEIYFFVQWTGDDSPSYERESWYYNTKEKKWMQKPKKMPDKYTLPAYEDKFAFLWEMNDSSPEFKEKGGVIFCFQDKKRTRSVGERMDIWHWKLDRTGPVKQLDDKFLTFYSDNPNGRTPDGGEGAYKDNRQTITHKGKKVTIPALWIPDEKDYHFILKDDRRYKKIITITDSNNLIDEDGRVLKKEAFTLGSKLLIPSVIHIQKATHSRGDVSAFEYYDAEKKIWNLEIRRERVNQNTIDDVQFKEKGKAYWFSIAVFDQAAIAHATPGGIIGTAYKMIMQ